MMNDGFSDLMNGHIDKPEEATTTKPKIQNNSGGNKYLNNPEEGLSLCASLISNSEYTGPNSKFQNEIKHIIEHEFLNHAEHDDNTTGARAYANLLNWQDKLAEAISFPQLEKSYTVAVGGSFSAGKTRFLTSVLGCPSLLPTDTTPTTSIPTYLFKGKENSIDALNFYGKKTSIDEEALKAICHSFNKQYGVTFSHLLQMIAVERKEFSYSNLIFLDTPGYSKADNIGDSTQNTDENIARTHLRSADYLIWLVDQQNGTVPKPDIDFIQSLDLQQPVLLVISKADKRPENLIREVIATAKADLERAEINYLDVIAYSAQNAQEISATGQRLTDFLDEINQGKNGSTLLWELEQIFKKYDHYYDSKHQMLSLTHKTINELIFDESISQDNRSHLTDINQKTKTQLTNLRNQKSEAQQIHSKLVGLLAQLCEGLGVVLALTPSIIQLQGIKKQGDMEALYFNALLQGELNKLSRFSSLNEIPGYIKKISSIGLVIEIDGILGIDIIIMKNQLKRYSTLFVGGGDVFKTGDPVKIQILDNKKCIVKVDIIL